MLTPSSGALAFGRALLWAAVVLSLALTAHFEGGGHLPPVEVIALVGALLLVVTTLAVRRQVRWPGGLALAGLGQYALHHVFSFLGGGCAPALRSGGLPDGGHAHLAGSPAGTLPGLLSGPGACVVGAEPAVMAPEMLVGHVLATVVTVGLLVGVERGVWLLAAWLVRPLPGVALWLPVVRRALVPVAPRAVVGPVDVHVAPVRGPPSSALVLHLAT